MHPSAKFNALISGTTVFVMFWALSAAAPLLKQASVSQHWLASLAALITSAGVYRLLSLGVRWLMERWEWLRGLVLGAHYMNGTWIGWFRGHSGELRLMVEHFTQDLESLAITGRSFDTLGQEHGFWYSEAVTVDVDIGRLTFTYSYEGNERSRDLTGIHSSLLERTSKLQPPVRYAGLAHDLNDPIRIAVNSVRIDNALLPWDIALARAQQQFATLLHKPTTPGANKEPSR